MPFVQRTIQPKNLSQKSLFDENGRGIVSDFELEAVTNNTLSNVLRQLSSLVLVANDIFEDLAKQLQDVHQRSTKLKASIHQLEDKVSCFDPKTVTVPEGDICTFSLRTDHFKKAHPFATNLFTASTRPAALQKIYEAAAPTPVHTIRKLDRFRRDGTRSSKFFMCTPVLGGGRKKRFKKVDLEIETRKPVAVEDLRRWTSTEAMGEMTVLPSNTSKLTAASTTYADGNDEVDHLLPSPEEQMMALALRFPPSIVAVDISGKTFDRMSGMRRSLINVELTSDGTGNRRKVRSKRHREKRRNTIAGTSQKEIEQAIAGETTTETEGCEFEPLSPLRSKSSDLFKLPKTTVSPADNIRNHFNTLKNWSKTKLRLINRNNSSDSCKPSFQGSDIVDDLVIYETISTVKRRREKERKPSSSSSAISIPVSTSSIATSLAVKLRENSLQRRHRRKGSGKDEPVHSSSGNWSASSESGRTSIASETTAPPKSSTTTSSNSLNHHQHPPPSSVQSRRRYLNASTSSSVSEGTITPDINDMQFHDFDGETSSVYSCDTEGYYTSFHMDSGLKTLKEEEIALSFSTLQLQDPIMGPATTTFNSSSGSGSSSVRMNQLTAENEYELFGKGSTSTTTSSAGTVCTTLLANGHGYGSTRSLSQFAPAVPERKSSLERKDKKQKEKGSDSDELAELMSKNKKYSELMHDSPSPDSGHNTSSSPAGSTSQNSQSPNEHLEFSESDLEGCERVERIRSKTAMTSCRIPSMCVITPPQSDDEVSLRNYNQVPYGVKLLPLNQDAGDRPVPIEEYRKDLTDIYALPDKSKKRVTGSGTVSTNGVLETNLDSVVGYATVDGKLKPAPMQNLTDRRKLGRKPDDGDYVTIMEKSKPEYVSLDELPEKKSSGENSLERKKRIGARVTLDSDGRVVYSSDSLKRRKQHSTFVPGKFVRDSPTPSQVLDHRTPKQIRPVHCSGLIRTNSDDRKPEPVSQIGKIIIRAGTRNCDSPTKDFIRIPPQRVVSPTSTPNPRRQEKGARIMMENGIARSSSPGSSSAASTLERKKRSPSPSSSSSSSKKSDANSEEGYQTGTQRWISTHPAVAQQEYSPSGFPRNHPMYWTLPARRPKEDGPYASPSKPSQKDFLSSTPTKQDRPTSVNLIGGMSPILKDNFLSPKTTMTSEEIFTAIHKSKKKLSLKDPENRSDSPSSGSSEWSLPDKARERGSWSPVSCDLDANRNEPRTRKSWNGAGTSINAFKKLLLQHGSKSAKDGRVSAVEQLKMSKRNQVRNEPVKTVRPVLNGRGRGQWRFSSPRTDILSSTIPEDCNEAEKLEEADAAEEKENLKSLEMTKKSLQEARKNFFSDAKSCGLVAEKSNTSNGSRLSQIERRKTSVISLETAL